MRNESIGDWLDDLASSKATPGGGAAAALSAATGAALVEMVTNLTIGKRKYAEYEETMRDVRDEATRARARALELAREDEAAFDKVMAAYGLPKDSEDAARARTAAIQAALVDAAEAPLRIAEVAAHIIALSERILEGANVNLISDITVAVESANAALRSAQANVDINLASMKDAAQRDEIAARLQEHLAAVSRGEQVTATISARVNGG